MVAKRRPTNDGDRYIERLEVPGGDVFAVYEVVKRDGLPRGCVALKPIATWSEHEPTPEQYSGLPVFGTGEA